VNILFENFNRPKQVAMNKEDCMQTPSQWVFSIQEKINAGCLQGLLAELPD
jgi:hypothetical protein